MDDGDSDFSTDGDPCPGSSSSSSDDDGSDAEEIPGDSGHGMVPPVILKPEQLELFKRSCKGFEKENGHSFIVCRSFMQRVDAGMPWAWRTNGKPAVQRRKRGAKKKRVVRGSGPQGMVVVGKAGVEGGLPPNVANEQEWLEQELQQRVLDRLPPGATLNEAQQEMTAYFPKAWDRTEALRTLKRLLIPRIREVQKEGRAARHQRREEVKSLPSKPPAQRRATGAAGTGSGSEATAGQRVTAAAVTRGAAAAATGPSARAAASAAAGRAEAVGRGGGQVAKKAARVAAGRVPKGAKDSVAQATAQAGSPAAGEKAKADGTAGGKAAAKAPRAAATAATAGAGAGPWTPTAAGRTAAAAAGACAGRLQVAVGPPVHPHPHPRADPAPQAPSHTLTTVTLPQPSAGTGRASPPKEIAAAQAGRGGTSTAATQSCTSPAHRGLPPSVAGLDLLAGGAKRGAKESGAKGGAAGISTEAGVEAGAGPGPLGVEAREAKRGTSGVVGGADAANGLAGKRKRSMDAAGARVDRKKVVRWATDVRDATEEQQQQPREVEKVEDEEEKEEEKMGKAAAGRKSTTKGKKRQRVLRTDGAGSTEGAGVGAYAAEERQKGKAPSPCGGSGARPGGRSPPAAAAAGAAADAGQDCVVGTDRRHQQIQRPDGGGGGGGGVGDGGGDGAVAAWPPDVGSDPPPPPPLPDHYAADGPDFFMYGGYADDMDESPYNLFDDARVEADQEGAGGGLLGAHRGGRGAAGAAGGGDGGSGGGLSASVRATASAGERPGKAGFGGRGDGVGGGVGGERDGGDDCVAMTAGQGAVEAAENKEAGEVAGAGKAPGAGHAAAGGGDTGGDATNGGVGVTPACPGVPPGVGWVPLAELRLVLQPPPPLSSQEEDEQEPEQDGQQAGSACAGRQGMRSASAGGEGPTGAVRIKGLRVGGSTADSRPCSASGAAHRQNRSRLQLRSHGPPAGDTSAFAQAAKTPLAAIARKVHLQAPAAGDREQATPMSVGSERGRPGAGVVQQEGVSQKEGRRGLEGPEAASPPPPPPQEQQQQRRQQQGAARSGEASDFVLSPFTGKRVGFSRTPPLLAYPSGATAGGPVCHAAWQRACSPRPSRTSTCPLAPEALAVDHTCCLAPRQFHAYLPSDPAQRLPYLHLRLPLPSPTLPQGNSSHGPTPFSKGTCPSPSSMQVRGSRTQFVPANLLVWTQLQVLTLVMFKCACTQTCTLQH